MRRRTQFPAGAVLYAGADGLPLYTSTLMLGGTNLGGGVGVVFIANATTVPTTNATGGGILYAEAGALKWRSAGGTTTTIAPN